VLAPIVLFAYSRLEHVQKAINSLLLNDEACFSDLIIFLDAPKSLDQASIVEDVYAYLRSVTGFQSITINRRTTNLGLSQSIISGVSHVLQSYKNIIVIEDDLIVSPYFLKYMNAALNLYEFHESVISIHGYTVPTSINLPPTFFLRGADCWGWATWQRGWKYFNSNGKYLYDQLSSNRLLREFDYDGSYPYSSMLKDQIEGRNDSWAVRWYASAFLSNKFTLYPGKSLVQNIGLDNSGTHCGTSSSYEVELSHTNIDVNLIAVGNSDIGRDAFKQFFLTQKKNFLQRFFSKLASLIYGK
jgi:hypothetical protein